MAKQTKKSSLLDRLRASKVRNETRHKEVKLPGGGSLPPGISGGIAKLTRLDFDVIEGGDYEGEQRLYVHGTCLEPKTFTDSDGNEHRTEGALVQLGSIKLCDTSYEGNVTPFEQNWEKAENRLKLLGIPTEDIDTDSFEEDVLAYVEATEIYFKFRTWKPQDGDRVSVVLEGSVKDYDPDLSDDVDDQTESDEPEEVNTLPPAKEVPAAKTAKARKSGKAGKAAPSEDEVIRALGVQGDPPHDSEEAQVDLTQRADALGLDTNDYEDWSSVAEVIIHTMQGGTTEEAEEEEELSQTAVPAKGDQFLYNDTNVEVTAVFEGKQKVNVRELDTKKIHRNVGFDELEEG